MPVLRDGSVPGALGIGHLRHALNALILGHLKFDDKCPKVWAFTEYLTNCFRYRKLFYIARFHITRYAYYDNKNKGIDQFKPCII